MKNVSIVLLLLWLFAACNLPVRVKPDVLPEKLTGVTYRSVPLVQTGWDIYVAGSYRYGPSIIVNADGSIDAWFAAAGGTYGIQHFDDGGNPGSHSPVALSGTNTAAQKFNATDTFRLLEVTCPTWGSTTSNLTLKLYKWNSSYSTTIAGTPLLSQAYVHFADNAQLSLTSTVGLPAGDYLWVLSNPSGTPGVWKYAASATGVTNYLNGAVVTGSYEATTYASLTTKGFWDQVAYRHSTDGGVTWTADQMVLKPTANTRDEYSICDPAAAKWGSYYYIGYTSTEDIRGLFNHVYVCRSTSPTGPWEKWNGTGWGGAPQPVVTFTGGPDYWGAGEPSLVVKNDTVFFYYTWDAGGTEDVTTRVATASATDANWPGSLTHHGTAMNKTSIGGADHSDVKYRDDLQKFQALHTASRLSASSYIVLWESTDGITFTKTAELRDSTLRPYLHNCGWSGNAAGHIDPATPQYVSYAYGPNWGAWNTRWHPLDFIP
jgi:hypothetical protein